MAIKTPFLFFIIHRLLHFFISLFLSSLPLKNIWPFAKETINSIDTGSLSGCLAVISSLYIPVAILIYQEFKDKHSFNEFEWDKTVLLQEVIKAKHILIAILASCISIILWNVKSVFWKCFILVIFIAGIVILVKNLVNLYRWFMSNKVGRANRDNYRQTKKIQFLKNLDPNQSLDVWSNILETIEPENAYLKDYLIIFFEKYAKAEQDTYWQYELCLTRNMSRLYYQNPDFQKIVMNFCFNAYTSRTDSTNILLIHKRKIIKKLFGLLLKDEQYGHYSISYFFDKMVSALDDIKLAFSATRDFCFDVLQEVFTYCDKNQVGELSARELIPLSAWNISAIPNTSDKTANTKALGLLTAYLIMLPSFLNIKDGRINSAMATHLDRVVFGIYTPNISRKIIKIVRLFFDITAFGLYDGESVEHARIRSFIDIDYGMIFMDSAVSVSSFVDPEETEEQRAERIANSLDIKEKQREDNTLTILSQRYGFLLNQKEMIRYEKAIKSYDPQDKRYKYRTSENNLKMNLAELEEVIKTIIRFDKTQNSK